MVVIVGGTGAELIVNSKGFCMVWFGAEESLKLNVYVIELSATGVPVIAPVAVSSWRLAGNAGVTDQL